MTLNTTSIKAGLIAAAIIVLGAPALTHAAMLTSQLELGMSGPQVTSLQIFLAQDSSVYPSGLTTGYFGVLTQAAVVRFQSRNDIPTVGRVGPITLSVINAQMNGGMSVTAGDSAPAISSVSANSNRSDATVHWNTNEPASGVVYYSSTPLQTTEYPHSVSISGKSTMTDSNFRVNQGVLLTGLDPNTTYYYMISATDQTGNQSVSWPATFRTTN